MTCTAASSCASCSRNMIAIEMRTTTSISAAWTGLRPSTTPRAATRAAAATRKKMMNSAIVRLLPPLALLGLAVPEAELARPHDPPLVGGDARRRGRTHPGARVVVLAPQPQLPRLAAGPPVVIDQQLVLRVDPVGSVRERELEELRLGDGLRRAGLDAHVAVDAAQVVDLVDEA